jgi:ketosteroid isomerase-like protein
MSSGANKAVVAEIYSAFGRGDLPGLIARLHGDVVWDVYGSPDPPIAGTWSGSEAVGQWFDLLGGTMEITLFEIDRIVAEADLVAVFGRESGTAQATNRDYTIAWAHLWTLKDGRVIRFQDFLDGSTLAEALREEGG